MDAKKLSELKQNLRKLVVTGISEALRALEEKIPSHCPKQDVVLALRSRLNEVNLRKVQGTLSQDQLQLAYNQLRADLITLISDLAPEDFAPAVPAKKLKDKKTGQILYKIPRQMQVNEETRCIVRLAFEVESIIRDIELTADVTLQPVRISEVMNVTLLDPNGEPAFRIRPFSSEEQFLEEGDFTEWTFFVTPLREGTYPLLLKVSVIEIIRGKERQKDLVLEETIRIAAVTDEQPTTGFHSAGYLLTAAAGLDVTDSLLPQAPGRPQRMIDLFSEAEIEVPQPAPIRRRSLRRPLTVAAGFLIIVVAALFLFDLPGRRNVLPTDQGPPVSDDSLQNEPDSLSTDVIYQDSLR